MHPLPSSLPPFLLSSTLSTLCLIIYRTTYRPYESPHSSAAPLFTCPTHTCLGTVATVYSLYITSVSRIDV
ncbi:hypothetical protein V8B97DRAFT_385976 [Scleroderma yunnanense]